MPRIRAFLIHLLISLLVIGTIAVALTTVWYPPEFAEILGGRKLLLMLAAIDVVAGPLLTLLVYKPRKHSLKADLSVIAVVQAMLLGYGLWTAWSSRPVFLVAAVDRLELVTASDIAPEDLAAAPHVRLPAGRPRLVGAQLPVDPTQRTDLLFESFQGRDLPQQPKYYVPYEAVATAVAKKGGIPLLSWMPRLSAAQRADITEKLSGRDPASVYRLPIHGRRGSSTMLVTDRGEVIVGLPIDPWVR